MAKVWRVCEVCHEYCLRVPESYTPYGGLQPAHWRHVLPELDASHRAKPLPLPKSPWRRLRGARW